MDYCTFGSGRKILVILPGLSVQSVMLSADAVAQLYASMTDDYTIYLFDRRKELPDRYPVKEMAKDTLTAIHTLGLKKVSIFGASQGGMMAMEIASLEPESVKKLILGSTSAHVEKARFTLFNQWIDLARSQDAAGLYTAFGKAIYPPQVFESAKEQFLTAAKTVTKEDLERFVILAEGIRDLDFSEDIKKIICPTLVLGSKDDNVLGGEASERIADVIKKNAKCEMFMYEGYGHAVYDLAPDYLERMKAFLAD